MSVLNFIVFRYMLKFFICQSIFLTILITVILNPVSDNCNMWTTCESVFIMFFLPLGPGIPGNF